TYFFGDDGPPLPHGVRARWRSAPSDPHGWHANMIGAIEGPAEMIGDVLDIAIRWFGHRGADTWVDADEWSAVFRDPELAERRGFVLNDDWDVMACWEHIAPAQTTAASLQDIRTRDEFLVAARIAEHAELHRNPTREDVERRMERYWREYNDWDSQFVLAWLDGHPVGTARLTDEQVPVLVGVATLPEARGRGVASMMTSVLSARALKSRDVCSLYVERDSQAAGIYRRIGYRPLFRTRAWVRRLEGA
ncbi:MAG: hypothetical protein AVDCRST_MAG93-1688, partial [uncultured Chloroflexia bacterium]